MRLSALNLSLRPWGAPQPWQLHHLLQHSAERDLAGFHAGALVGAPPVVDVGLEVTVETDLGWVREDDRVEGRFLEVDENAVVGRDREGLVAVGEGGVKGEVTENGNGITEASRFEEAGCGELVSFRVFRVLVKVMWKGNKRGNILSENLVICLGCILMCELNDRIKVFLMGVFKVEVEHLHEQLRLVGNHTAGCRHHSCPYNVLDALTALQ